MTGYLIYEASKARTEDLLRVAAAQRLARSHARARPQRARFPRIRRRLLRRPRTA